MTDEMVERGNAPMVDEILYVGTEWPDDVRSSLEVARSRLNVHTVSDAATARSELETTDFDCIVSEYELSDGSGTEFLSAVTGEPTILLASEDAEPTTGDAVSANVTDYLLIEQVDDQYTDLTESIESAVNRGRRTQRDRHRAALEMADIGTWEYDVATDTLWMSDIAREMHGLAPETSATLDGMVELYVPEKRRTVREIFDRAINEGEPFDETVKLDSDDGQWMRICGQPVRNTESVRYIRGCCQDVRKLKQRQEQFKILHSAGTELMEATSREEAAQITIDAAKNILGYAKAALRLVDENEEVLRVFATTKDNVAAAGERPDYRVDEDVPASRTYRQGQPQVFSDLEVTQDEYERGALRSGLYVPVGDHGVFSCGNLEVDAYDQTDVDIVSVLTRLTATALTRIEADRKIRQKKDQLESFTSIVAHDLRNPLQIINGRLELARRDPEEGHFDAMENELDRMKAIIEDVLTLARAGRSIDEVDSVSLSEVVHEAWQHAQTVGLDLTVRDDLTIKADRERLLHVFENLFRNAIDHNDPPVTLTIGQIDENQSDGGASIGGFFVEDDGGGIPPNERGDVFDHGYTTRDSGTGFGLSIVRHVADAHGWTVDVADGRDGGARFEFTNVNLALEATSQ